MTYTIVWFLFIWFRVNLTKKVSFLQYDYINDVNKLASTWSVSKN